ncbi:MAG: peptidase M15A [Gammaproteobacteria bacterium]|nr:peptidase M15A [Gammaproteobacteria bacterium]
MFRRFPIALSLLMCCASAAYAAVPTFDTGLSAFSVRVKGLDIGYREFALFAMPGEKLSISVPHALAVYQAHADAGRLIASGAARWYWTAPAKPGHYSIEIRRGDGASLRLQTFVMVPASAMRNGRLKGYRIGRYPSRPLNGLSIYDAPAGFVEVTPELAQLHVSPHFTLGEFLCKEAGGYPKFLVLRRRLLLKLEALTAYLDKHGVPPTALHIMSGYRTPWYNARLGNVPYSRHMWGDAADIYISVQPLSADAVKEGRDDYMNSQLLALDARRLFKQPAYAELQGGIGVYPATDNHPPFVHVDARGFKARWTGQ